MVKAKRERAKVVSDNRVLKHRLGPICSLCDALGHMEARLPDA